METNNIAEKISKLDAFDLYIYRMFNDCPESKTIVRRLNDLMIENPDTMDVTLALFLYPMIKWTLKSKNTCEIMSSVCDGVKRLENVQNIIMDATGLEPKLLLKNREIYFEACEELVELVDMSIEVVADFPQYGKHYSTILKLFTEDNSDKVNRKLIYHINKYIKEAVLMVHTMYAERYEKVIDKILTGAPQSTEEEKYVYHNIKLLLNEYKKILWYSEHSDDKALQLLSCKSVEEMEIIARNDSTYVNAYLIIEYIRLIDGAIEKIKEFPHEGMEYYKIIKALVDKRTTNLTDAEIAKQLQTSSCNFALKKRRALTVLSSILWGYNGDSFVYLLTKKK